MNEIFSRMSALITDVFTTRSAHVCRKFSVLFLCHHSNSFPRLSSRMANRNRSLSKMREPTSNSNKLKIPLIQHKQRFFLFRFNSIWSPDTARINNFWIIVATAAWLLCHFSLLFVLSLLLLLMVMVFGIVRFHYHI